VRLCDRAHGGDEGAPERGIDMLGGVDPVSVDAKRVIQSE
jgi:hypothetical protein